MQLIANFLRWTVLKVFRIQIVGEENLPSEGACVACINHISLFDPLVTSAVVPRPIRFMGKEELFRIPVIGWYLKTINVIPVKRGSGDIGAIKSSLKALRDGEVLGIFPTGTREKKNPDAPVKPGAALIALKADVPVIPIHINADYRLFSKVTITVGRAVDLSLYSGRKLSQEELKGAAEEIYTSIKHLGGSR